MNVALKFGQRTVAVAIGAGGGARVAGHPQQAPQGRGPMGRVYQFNSGARPGVGARMGRGGNAAMGRAAAGYSPGAGMGADCPTPQQLRGPNAPQTGAWCSNMLGAGPIPLGAGETVVPARVGNANGVATLTLNPREGYTVEDVEITDPSGRVMVASVFAGRCDWLERGPVGASRFATNNTACKLLQGFRAFPSVGIDFTFQNPTLSDVPIQVTLMGWPDQCGGQQQPGQQPS